MLSKTYILAWAALGILLFSGCREEKSEQEHAEPNELKTKASETVLPATFKFSTGGMRGSHIWEWDGEALRYEASVPPGVPRITKTVTPSAEQWRAFWERMDEVEVWKWRAQYEPNAIIDDGGFWSLELEHGGKIIRSSGNNAYPSDEDVTVATTMIPTAVFNKFREAVSTLMVSGFSTEKSEQEHAEPNEQKREAPETLLPTTLNYTSFGISTGTRYSLEWDGEVVKFEKSTVYREPEITKTAPSAEQWQAFWAKMEEINVWEWRGRYDPNFIYYDGGNWAFELEYKGKKVKSSGSVAHPSSFGELLKAMLELIGRKTWR